MPRKSWVSLFLLMWLPSSALPAVGEVKRIYPAANGTINFQLKADSCNAEYTYYYFDSTTPQGRNWYSLLLAAASTGALVAVRFVGDEAPCDPNVVKLIHYIYVDY